MASRIGVFDFWKKICGCSYLEFEGLLLSINWILNGFVLKGYSRVLSSYFQVVLDFYVGADFSVGNGVFSI